MKLQDHPVLPSTTQYYPDSSIGSLCTKIPLPENSIHTKCHQDMILEKSQEGTAQSSKVHCAQGVQFPDTFHQWHLNQSRWLSHFFWNMYGGQSPYYTMWIRRVSLESGTSFHSFQMLFHFFKVFLQFVFLL